MATLGATCLTISDWAKRQDPSGRTSTIVEALSETNEILEDIGFVEGNLPTGHKTTIRTGLPTVAWRLLNYGVQPSKSTTAQVTDNCGMLEGYSNVDKSLADLNGDTAAFRWSEDQAFLQAMGQEMADTLFYGNSQTDPEKFLGLTPRFNDGLGPANAANVIAGGGSGADNQSIWLICWGDQTCFGIFPKGSMAGLQSKDLGEVTLDDAQSPAGHYQGYRTHYKWDAGLCVKDWRYVVRVCNIDHSAMIPAASSGADLADLMVRMLGRLPSLKKGVPYFYVNEAIHTMLRRQIRKTSNVNLTLDTVAGQEVLKFDGVPVRRCDALTIAEDLVSFS